MVYKLKKEQLTARNDIYSVEKLSAFKGLVENLIRLKVIDLNISQLRHLHKSNAF